MMDRVCHGNIDAMMRWRRQRTGKAAIELVIVIGMIAAVLMSLSTMTAQLFNHTSSDVTAALGDQSNFRQATNGESVVAASSSGDSLLKFRIVLLFAVLMGWVGYAFLRISARQTKAEQNQPDEQDQVIDQHTYERMQEKRKAIRSIITRDNALLFRGKIYVRDFMTTKLLTVSPDCSLGELEEIFSQKQIHHLLVTDQQEKLVGIISDRDILQRQGNCAADVMTAAPVSLSVDADINMATSIMMHRRISALPVVENDRPCGMITSSDMVAMLQAVLNALAEIGRAIGQKSHSGIASEYNEASGLQDDILRIK